MSIRDTYTVSKIPSKETYPWLLKKHYAHRIPSISFAFGIYKGKILNGILTIGKPPSPSLCVGVCGHSEAEYVYELNRLCINEHLEKNILSFFVSKVMTLLPPLILVSYADTSKGHHGFIYQASNWIYTGLSVKAKNRVDENKEHNRHGWKKGGDLVDRVRKHRYIYFTGSKKQKKYWKAKLLYKEEPYPKGENSRYDASFKPQTQLTLFG